MNIDSLAHKIVALLSSLSLLIQSFSPLASAIPVKVFAEESLKAEVDFKKDTNKFTLTVNNKDANTDGPIDYILVYRTDKGQNEAIKGLSDKDLQSNFNKDFYAGTCSSQGVCTPDFVVRGLLKVKVESQNWITGQKFVIDDGKLKVIEEYKPQDSDLSNLSKSENYWLEYGTELSPTPTVTSTPKITPISTITTRMTPTSTVVEDGQILDGISAQRFSSVYGLMSLKTDGHVDATIIESYSCRADSLNGCLVTDKSDYAPTDVVVITGYGFAPKTEYTLRITSSDPPPVTFETTITTDVTGSFTASYQLDGNYRPNYLAELKNASGAVVATTTFTDSPQITYSDFEGEISPRGSNNWTNGNISGYKEGDAVRFRIKLDSDAGNLNGDLYIGFTSDPACRFFAFKDPDSIELDFNPSTDDIDPGEGFSVKYISLTQKGTDAVAKFHLSSSAKKKVRLNFTLYLSSDAAGCASGSSQHVQIEDVTGDIKKSGKKTLPISASAVAPVTDITVTKVASSSASIGESIDYVVAVKNLDPSTPASNVTVVDYLPDGVTFVSGFWTKTSPSEAGSCNVNRQTVTCVLGTLNGGATSSIIIKVNIDNNTLLCSKTLTNNVSVSTTTLESNIENNTTRANTTINPCLGMLKLIKDVINDNGGTASPSAWTLSATGRGGFSGKGPIVGPNNVIAGETYTLSESGGPSGYTPFAWICYGGGIQNGNNITLGLGDNVTCTITNDDQPGTLIVKKVIVGSTQNYSDFSFRVNGGQPQNFESDGENELTVNAGNYTIIEDPNSDYSIEYDNCSNIFIPNGGSATCTITNTKKGSITIVKDAVPNSSQEFKFTGDLGQFTSVDDGTNTNTNNSIVLSQLVPGTYTVIESDVQGWTLDSINCGEDSDVETDINNRKAIIELKAGKDITCTFVNTRDTGSVKVNKLVDNDGNGTFETENPDLFTWSLDDSGLYSMGSIVNGVNTGSHLVNENSVVGYHFVGWYPGGINNDDYSCTNLPEDTKYRNLPADITVTKNNTTEITLCNARDTGTLQVNKIVDNDGDGKYESINPEKFKWGTESADLANTDMGTSQTLITGTYDIFENNVDGYIFTGWFFGDPEGNQFSCENLPEGPEYTQLPKNIEVAANKITNLTLCNQFVNSKLEISKFNNAVGDKAPGDTVYYTLKIKALLGKVNGVKVKDILPKGFTFGGTWIATLNGNPLSVPNPNYHSPGTWVLGDLNPGDEVIITFPAIISNDQSAGLYKDIAWASGTNVISKRVLAEAQPEGFVSTNFVGTAVSVNKEQQSTTSIDIVKKEERGEVLGASTSLPETGGKTIWMIIATILTFFGGLLVTLGLFIRKKIAVKVLKILVGLALFLGLAFVGVQPASAVNNLSIRLAQPKSPTYFDTFNITFVVLDLTENPSPITVRCFKKGPDDRVFSQFGSNIVVAAGGGTGNCSVTSSIMNKNGLYQFYATATNGTDNATSENEGLISVDFNTSGPGTPSNYSKEKLGCSYKIKFKTSDDGGKTTKVEVYRSDNTSFRLDSGTRVAVKNIGSNTDGEVTDNVPDCNKTYYYAVRAFDLFGNGSGAIGDSIVTIISAATTTGDTITEAQTGAAIPVEGVTLPAVQESVLGTKEEEETKEGTVMGEATPSGKPEVINLIQSPLQKLIKMVKDDKKRTLVFILILGVVGTTLYYVFKKRSRQTQE